MNNEPDLTAVSPLAHSGTTNAKLTTRALAWARTGDGAIALALALVCLITRLLAVPASLWEWDDILFARALHRYDLVAHSPHPPGFPVFVMLTRAAFWLLGDEHRALTTVALVGGVLLGPALFYFYREVFQERMVAVVGALITSFAPNIWVQGAMGRSDGPALTIGLIALALIVRGLQSRGALLIGCLVFGLGMGVRATLLPVVAPALAVVLLARLRARQWKLVVGAVTVTAAGALCWYVPLVLHTTWHTYRGVSNQHAQFIFQTDTIWAATENGVLSYRIERFFDDLWGASWVMAAIYVLAILGVTALARQRQWRALGCMVVAFLPYLAFTFILNTPLGAPLYSLPYVPFFTGLAACGLVLTPRLIGRWPRWLGPALGVGLTVALIGWTYPAIKLMHREVSPPLSALRYLQGKLDPQRDVLFYDGVFEPHLEFYLPGVLASIGDEKLRPEVNLINLLTDRAHFVGLTEVPSRGANQKHFHWPKNRGERRLRRLSLGRYFDAYVSDFTATRGALFLSGWYGEEHSTTYAWRWMSGRGQVALVNGATEMVLHLRGVTPAKPNSNRPPTIVIHLDGTEVARFNSTNSEFDRTLTLKPDPARLWSTLQIETDVTFNPRRDAGLPDDREAGLQIFVFEWSPAPGAARTLRAPAQFLGAGWYDLEGEGNETWRWTNGAAQAQLPPLTGDGQLDLKLFVPQSASGAQVEVTIELAGQTLDKFPAPWGFFTKTYQVPAALHRAAPVELKLLAPPYTEPAEVRPLAMRVYYLGWRPAATP